MYLLTSSAVPLQYHKCKVQYGGKIYNFNSSATEKKEKKLKGLPVGSVWHICKYSIRLPKYKGTTDL